MIRLFALLLLFLSFLAMPVAAQVSTECKDETDVLNQNAAVSSSLDAAENNALEASSCEINGSTFKCVVDYGPFDDSFGQVCVQEGGQPYNQDLSIVCRGEGATVDFRYTAIPSCVGASCNTANLDAAFTGAFAAAEREANALSSGDGFSCEISAAVSVKTLFLSVTSALLAGLFSMM